MSRKTRSTGPARSRGLTAETADGRPSLRIAIIAPPWFDIPPVGYGGIECVCYFLVEGLVDRGHDVTLVAAGVDGTRARFVQALPAPPPGLGTLDAGIQEVAYAAAVGHACANLDVDVVHDHSLATPLLALRSRVPTVLTAHGPTDGWLGAYYRAFSLPLVAVSEFQRSNAPDLRWVGTVPNAIDVDQFRFTETKDDFVLFLGRLSPEKGAHLAAEAARAAEVEFVLAGECKEAHERRYFENEVAPRGLRPERNEAKALCICHDCPRWITNSKSMT